MPRDAGGDLAVEMVAGQLRAPRDPAGAPWLLLAVTLLLFIGSNFSTVGTTLGITVAVLLFHEAGHALGMRLFGYRDVRIFFIPFLGAAVSGEGTGVAPWRRGVVLLLGPAPGLMIGALLLLAAHPTGWLRTVAVTLTVINALNLLPLYPLDGGRLTALLLPSRFAVLDSALRAGAVAGFVALGVQLREVVWYVLALLVALSIRPSAKINAAARNLRELWSALPEQLSLATVPQARDVAEQTMRVFGRPDMQREPPAVEAAIKRCTIRARQVYERAVERRPTGRQSLLLGSVYAAGLAISAFPCWLIVHGGALRRGDAGALEPLTERIELPATRIVAHYPASFTAKRSSETQLRLSRDLGDAAEMVMLFTMRTAPSNVDAIAAAMNEGLVEHLGYQPGPPEATTCNGAPGVASVGTATLPKGGFKLRVRTCSFLKMGRGFFFVSAVSEAIADEAMPALTRIIDATEIQP